MAVLWTGPGAAFVLLIAGLLAVYSEFVWPGRVWPGLSGCALTVAGAYFLWRNAPTAIGLVLIGIAGALFVAEVFLSVDLICGIAGTAALAAGFYVLFPPSRRISPVLSIPVSLAFGGITAFLALAAKRARRNKRSDIEA
jgi:membrane-bound serine protease (ClpP class)